MKRLIALIAFTVVVSSFADVISVRMKKVTGKRAFRIMRKLKTFQGALAQEEALQNCEGGFRISGKLSAKVYAECRFEPGHKPVCIKERETNFVWMNEQRQDELGDLHRRFVTEENCIL